jgi:RNA polymerase sigma factor (sigma-70 family)
MSAAHLTALTEHLHKLAQHRVLTRCPDRQLLDDFVERQDQAAFATLVARHGPMVLRVCRRVLGHAQDAEDAFQATFLVLARNSRSIRKPEALADWLHGVAHRIAMKAQRSQARRRNHEARSARPQATTSPTWDDVQVVLDEEIRRLSEPLRAAFVLCVFEGKTGLCAAQELGIREGTLSSRLTRARQHLRQRLIRRGIELSAVMAALSVMEAATEASVPGTLAHATVRIGILVSAGQGAGGIPSHIATMASAAARALFLTRMKTAVILLCAGGVLAGGGVFARAITARALHSGGAPPAAIVAEGMSASARVARASDSSASTADQKTKKERIVHGRVLDPDGKPFSGAKIVFVGKDETPEAKGGSGADGAFSVTVPKLHSPHYLLAMKEGAGLDFFELSGRKTADPIEFRLVRDNLIRGRVVDTEGKPVAGVRVALQHVIDYGSSADSLLAEWKTRNEMAGLPASRKMLWLSDGFAAPTQTSGRDGSFVISGVGRERLAGLRLSGAGIADVDAWVVNRPGFDPAPYNEATRNNASKYFVERGDELRWLLHAPEFTLVAEAEKPIHGVVVDADTGKPRPGVEVALTRFGDGLVHVIPKAKTDANGQYQLHGARKLKDYMVEVQADPEAGYMASQARASDTPGYEPIMIDVRVMNGVVITGRVIDKSTGETLPGLVMAAVLSDNPFAKKYPEFGSSGSFPLESTRDDGTFRIVSIPGPVLLMGGPDRRWGRVSDLDCFRYKGPVPDPKYPQYFNVRGGFPEYYRVGGGRGLVQGTCCKVLQIDPGTKVVQEDIVLERASSLPVKIRDEKEQPIRQTWATGISATDFMYPVRIESESCFAYGVEPGKRRVMAFYEPTRKLFGSVVLNGNEKTPVVVKLGPPARLKGRLVTEEGTPVPRRLINVYYTDRQATEIYNHAHREQRIVTDGNGVFEIQDLIPDLEFKLYHDRSVRPTFQSNPVTQKAVIAKAGELLDLGDLKVKADAAGE